MAQIFPFSALRYNPEQVDLARVVTQPYDKITPEMQARYYDASPFNLVRVELGRAESTDDEQQNVYTRAAATLHDWRTRGIMRAEPRAAIFRYSQTFTVPAGSAVAGQQFERTGFIALGQLEDYSAGVVFRHEQTHSGPKLDRLRLLRATRTHTGQMFMLYRDPQRRIESLLASAEAVAEVKDEYDVIHRLWRTNDDAVITQIQDAMHDRQLIIADGHHRYETALAYRNERREEALQSLAAGASSGSGTGSFLLPPENVASERAMMTFVNIDSPGLVVLPTHRVVFDLPNFESGVFVEGARQCFDFRQVPGSPDPEKLLTMISDRRPGEIKMAAVTRLGAWLLSFRPRDAKHLIGALSPRQQQLDVVVLHRVLLNEMLGITDDAIRDLRNIAYYRDAREAVDRVRDGADVAFLLNAVSVEQVADVALAGEVMPQKSTDFYPKLLSGLTIYALDQA